MTAKVGNWIGESTTTVGTGSILLTGPVSGFTSFESVGDGEVWYAIIDGVDKEAGKGTLTGTTLQRTNVYSTLVSGVYNEDSPGPLNLSGTAIVYSTFNRTAFDEFSAAVDKLAGIEDGATADQEASDVPYENTISGLAATDVQAAIDEVDGRLDTVEVDLQLAEDDIASIINTQDNNTVLKTSSTGSAQLPTGVISERDGAIGSMRFNSETDQFEGKKNSGDYEGLGGASGGAGNPFVYENDIIVTEDYTITAGKNAMSAGPITIADGITLTIPTGSTYTVVGG